MADRWVSTPHVFPHCCHRCSKSGEENGPYLHEEWDFCKPDRWPGVSPDAPRVARKFTCRSCFQHALNLPDAPVFDDVAHAEALRTIDNLEAELELAKTELARPVEVIDVQAVLELLEAKEPKKPAPRTRKKAA